MHAQQHGSRPACCGGLRPLLILTLLSTPALAHWGRGTTDTRALKPPQPHSHLLGLLADKKHVACISPENYEVDCDFDVDGTGWPDQIKKMIADIKPYPINPNKPNQTVAIVQFETRPELGYAKTAEVINKAYCDKHTGYTYMKFTEHESMDKLPVYWAKVAIIQDVMLSNPAFDYVVWMDSDAVVSNHSLRFEHMPEFDNPDIGLVVGEDSPRFYDNEESVHSHPNTGVFVVRNNQNGIAVVNEWISRFNKTGHWQMKPTVLWENDRWGCDDCAWADDDFEQGALRKMIFDDQDWSKVITTVPWHVFGFDLELKECLFVCHLAFHTLEYRQKSFTTIAEKLNVPM